MKTKHYNSKAELDKDIDQFLRSLPPRRDNWPIIIQEELNELLDADIKNNVIYVSTLVHNEGSLTGFKYGYCLGYKRDKKTDVDFTGFFNHNMEYPPSRPYRFF